MLKNILIGKPTLNVECNNCSTIYESPYAPGLVKKFLNEYSQFENLISEPCPNCETVEVFNMNIPVDDTDEPFATGDLPVVEEVQRYYMRLLIREVREDFVNAK